MPGCFLDTSALAKLYHAEEGSAVVEELAGTPDTLLVISQLSLVEIQSVFAGKVRTRVIPASALDQLRGRFYADLAEGRLQMAILRARHWTLAESFIREHAVRQSLRTLDALQLAVAVDLHRRNIITTLVASDRNLCAVAMSQGMKILNPLETAG